MTEYKGITHTLMDMLEARRKSIHAVPRDTKTKRTDLKYVARPDDKRDGEIPTRQAGVVIHKTEDSVNEQDVNQPQDPNKPKKTKKLEIEDIGKQPPTKVEINPELDNTPNLFASKDEKGKIIESFGRRMHPGYMANLPKKVKSTDFQGGEDTPDPRARREAEDIARYVKQFQGKTVGGIKIVGKLSDKHIEQGARIRARLNKLKEAVAVSVSQEAAAASSRRHDDKIKKEKDETDVFPKSQPLKVTYARGRKLNKGDLSEDKYNNVAIQYQTTNGIWVTARKTSDNPSDIMLAMKNVQKAYGNNRIRAVGARGQVVDMWPIDPADLQREEIYPPGSVTKHYKDWKRKEQSGYDTTHERDRDRELSDLRARVGAYKGGGKGAFPRPSFGDLIKIGLKKEVKEQSVPFAAPAIAISSLTTSDAVRRRDEYLQKTEKKHPGYIGSPGHKKLQDAAQKHADRENKRLKEETEINEIKKNTLISFMNKVDQTPQKDAAEMNKVWKDRIWPARDRIHGKFKTKSGEKPYKCEETIDEGKWKDYTKQVGKEYNSWVDKSKEWGVIGIHPPASLALGAAAAVKAAIKMARKKDEVKESDGPSKEEEEAFRKFMKYPSDPENVEGMHKALQHFRSLFFRRKHREANEDTDLNEITQAEIDKFWDSLKIGDKKRLSKLVINKHSTLNAGDDNLQSPGVATIEKAIRKAVNEILTYKNSARLRARDAYAQAEAQQQQKINRKNQGQG